MTASERREQFAKFKRFLGSLVWKLFISTIFIGVAWFFVELGFVYILQIFLRGIGLIEGQQTFIPSWLPNSLPVTIAALISFGIFRSAVLLAKNLTGGMINQIFIKEQRANILTLTLTQHPSEPSSEIVALFSERVTQAGAFVQFVAQLLVISMTSILLAGMGLWIAPVEFLCGIAFLGISYFPLNRLNKYITKSAHGISFEWSRVTTTLMIGLKNSFLLRLYQREKHEAQAGSAALEAHLKHYFSYYKVSSARFILPNILGIIAISLITTVSVTYMKTSPIKLLSLFYLFIRLSQSLSEFGTCANDARLFLPSFKAVYQFILKYSQPIEVVAAESFKKDQIAPPLHCRFDRVSFAYDPDNILFENLSLDIKSGSIFLLKGESGTGKSTFLSLMGGLLKPTAGQILINGKPVEEIRSSLAETIAYVGPEPYLLPGTVRENLLYPKTKAVIDDQILWQALRDSHIDHVIEGFPKGLDHLLFEDTQLSTGQKQRLALARALIRQPGLLILDEATANIDVETEGKIIQTLIKKKASMLITVVSHRSTFDAIADQVMSL